ncbi:angiotensin-converting enzyme 3 [Anopheles darlingi]|uniref:Angiotensin-converting enzyme 3 n=1 Tax=Anopheles darlingi TaxID=43151 RepID=W5JJR0_ANODA|nr:angiotensin-converting enzyme 3 [Anopheles darlingi]
MANIVRRVTLVLVLIGVRSIGALAIPTSTADEAVNQASEVAARTFVDELESDILQLNYNTTLLSWAYETNITDDTLMIRDDAVAEQSRFLKVAVMVHDVPNAGNRY